MFNYSPLSHIFAIGILSWLWLQLRNTDHDKQRLGARLLVVGTLSAWVVISSIIAYLDNYLQFVKSTSLFPIAVFVPIILLVTLSLCSKNVKELFVNFADNVSLSSLTVINIIRIGAIGTIIHYFQNKLPGHFIIPITFPDLLIGLSAFFMSRLAITNKYNRWLLAWHSVGATVFLLAVPLMLLSQPGAFSYFTEGPNTDSVFAFPMVIIPTFVAPILLTLHGLAIVKLLRSNRTMSITESNEMTL